MVGLMQVNPKNFASLFTSRATRTGSADASTAQEPPAAPSDSFLGRIARTLGFGATPQVKVAQQTLSIQAAASALGPAQALSLAQDVGVELLGDAVYSGQEFKSKIAGKINCDNELNSRMGQVWTQIQSVTGSHLETPILLNDPASGPGRFVGSSLFADASAFAELPKEVALFYTAHEVGHVENQDAARKQGMTLLKGLLAGTDQRQLQKARQKKDWEMEHRADARAAEICANLKTDPVPILRDLMKEPSGDQHPPGLERAARVREVFASHGLTVSDQQYASLHQETAEERTRRQKAIDDDLALRAAFEELR